MSSSRPDRRDARAGGRFRSGGQYATPVTDERGSLSAHRTIMAMVAPGTQLRAGLERILAGRTGALIVLGIDRTVEALCDGGFRLDVEFSPTRLRELTKMDGAVLLSADAHRILGANIQ